jgi:hypothetical protein
VPHRVLLPLVNREMNDCYGDTGITAYLEWNRSSALIIPNQYTKYAIATACIFVVNFTYLS